MPLITDIVAADRKKIVSAALVVAAATYLASLQKGFGSTKAKSKKDAVPEPAKPNANGTTSAPAVAIEKKTEVKKKDKSFLKVLMRVLKLGIGKREKINMFALTSALFLRTGLSIFMNSHLGQTIGYFCNKDWQKVSDSVIQFAKISVFAAIVNASLHAFTDLLSYNLRSTLTRKAHNLYKERMNFYMVNWVGKDVLENTDQLIAEDIEKFSDAFSSVYNQSLKPLVDFILFSMQLAAKLGPEGPFVLFVWFGIAGLISKRVLPPYGKLAAHEQLLEGRFRARHAAIIKNAEMVSFMRGEEPETGVLNSAFNAIRKHQMSLLNQKFIADTTMGYLNKYFATVIGFLLTVRPVITDWNGMGSYSPGEIASFFVSTRSTLEGLAASVLAIFELQKRVGQLAGLASRVDVLFDGLEKREPILRDEMQKAIKAGNPPTRVVGDVLKFDRVDVYKPDGVLLLKNLSIEVPRGMRVIITGDNGCGKSSLFRVICGLWPLVSGTLRHPPAEKVYFLSQVNFVPVGTLRQVLTYPHSVPASKELDAKLSEIMRWAHLEDLKCDGVKPSLDDALEWDTALSPGQKQRIAFARLFYANPQYAILDECTNGVAPDVEASLYERCAKMGMAIFSISHKVELKKLHDFELHYRADGTGGWDWIDLKKPN